MLFSNIYIKATRLFVFAIIISSLGFQINAAYQDSGLDPEGMAAAAIVRIKPIGHSPASGVLISSEGHILTAAHIACSSTGGFNADQEFFVRIETDISERDPQSDDTIRQQWHKAELVNISDSPNPLLSRDLALLKLVAPPADLPYIKVGDSRNVQVDDPVLIVGYPISSSGRQRKLEERVIEIADSSAFLCGAQRTTENAIVTTGEGGFGTGFSGGALISKRTLGLVGIMNAELPGTLAQATPINVATTELIPSDVLPSRIFPIVNIEWKPLISNFLPGTFIPVFISAFQSESRIAFTLDDKAFSFVTPGTKFPVVVNEAECVLQYLDRTEDIARFFWICLGLPLQDPGQLPQETPRLIEWTPLVSHLLPGTFIPVFISAFQSESRIAFTLDDKAFSFVTPGTKFPVQTHGPECTLQYLDRDEAIARFLWSC